MGLWSTGLAPTTAACVNFLLLMLTHHCKFRDLKQHKCIIYTLKGQKSKMGLTGLKPRCQQVCVPLWRLQGGVYSPAFSSF